MAGDQIAASEGSQPSSDEGGGTGHDAIDDDRAVGGGGGQSDSGQNSDLEAADGGEDP